MKNLIEIKAMQRISKLPLDYQGLNLDERELAVHHRRQPDSRPNKSRFIKTQTYSWNALANGNSYPPITRLFRIWIPGASLYA